MTLVKWDPWREIEDMFDRYTRAVGKPGVDQKQIGTEADWAPRVDIHESEKDFVISAEIPGIGKDDIKVDIADGVLSIRGERKQEKEEKGKKFHRIERVYGSFRRSFSLPDNVDESKIKASFKDGVLSLSIPKTPEKEPKAIDIKID
ncbi:MAG: Hsp20/alpha crystallin family protein [Deltaproteobacteria bacterium]|nr:Hsp20/alpha crystallin family protein [Deltaproteobacteria bacterium]